MRNLFIVAPHFPPSFLPPAQRARLIVNHVHKFGFNPVIFTTTPEYREEKEDPWMVELLSAPYDKVEVKALRPGFTRKFGVGDLGLRMLPYLLRALIREKRRDPAFIIYLVPPWYLMLIAPIVKRITKVPYAIDFIDPWVAQIVKSRGTKHRISQWIARKMEGWVTRHADYIYAVSDQINHDLVERHPDLKNKIFRSVPYGVEAGDYRQESSGAGMKNEVVTIRYIGAVWKASYPVLETFFAVLRDLKESGSFRVEFIGTSYASNEMAKSQLEIYKKKYELEGVLEEYPKRRPYREAMSLTMHSDILMIFGDMGKQYAASKLMGLIASGKPFFAFLHRETYPYQFLKDMGHPFLVGYTSEEGDMPSDHAGELKRVVKDILENYGSYIPLNTEDERFLKHTAEGMTKNIVEPIKNLLEKDGKSH